MSVFELWRNAFASTAGTIVSCVKEIKDIGTLKPDKFSFLGAQHEKQISHCIPKIKQRP